MIVKQQKIYKTKKIDDTKLCKRMKKIVEIKTIKKNRNSFINNRTTNNKYDIITK